MHDSQVVRLSESTLKELAAYRSLLKARYRHQNEVVMIDSMSLDRLLYMSLIDSCEYERDFLGS